MLYRKLTPYDGTLPNIVNYATNTNAGKAWIRGIELAGSLPLASWLNINASYSYTDSKLYKDETGTGLRGTKLRYVPAHLASFSLDVTQGRFRGNINATYTGKQFGSEDNSDVIRDVPGGYSAFWLVNARVQYRLIDRVTIGATIANLADKRYYEFYRAPGRSVAIDLIARY